MRRTIITVSAFTAIGICFLIAEILSAVYRPSAYVSADIFGNHFRNQPQPEYFLLSYSGNLFYDLTPNQSGRTKYLSNPPYHWRVNSLSLRTEREIPKQSKAYRILLIGDSQVFGLVSEKETLSKQLELFLAHDTPVPIEVLNGGVPGYGTIEGYWKLSRLLDEIDVDMVIASTYLSNNLVPNQGNDLLHTFRATRQNSRGKPQSVRIRDENYSLLRQLFVDHSHFYGVLSGWKRRFQGNGKSYGELVKEYDRSKDARLPLAWQQTRMWLKKMDALAQSKGQARFLVLHLPHIEDIRNGDDSAIEELKKSNLPLVSAFDALAAQDTDSLTLDFDYHYNGSALRLIAYAVAESDLIEIK